MLKLSKTSVTEEPFPLVQAHIFAPYQRCTIFSTSQKSKIKIA